MKQVFSTQLTEDLEALRETAKTTVWHLKVKEITLLGQTCRAKSSLEERLFIVCMQKILLVRFTDTICVCVISIGQRAALINSKRAFADAEHLLQQIMMRSALFTNMSYIYYYILMAWRNVTLVGGVK